MSEAATDISLDEVMREQVLAFLQSQDAECPACLYSLRGLTAPRCPECGAELRLRLQSPDVLQRFWLTSLVTLLIATGFHLMFFLFFIVYATIDSGFPGPLDAIEVFGWPFTILTAVFPALSIAVLMLHRQFLRLSRVTQATIVMVLVAVVAVVELVIMASMF